MLYATAADLVQAEATWSVQAGAINALYPLANLSDRYAHTVTRATGTGLTVRATFGGAQALEAIALIHTNATAIQITSGGGLNQAVTVPAVPGDGLPLDPWLDLRELAGASSTTFDIALTGPTGVGVGEIVLAETLRTLELVLDSTPREEELHRAIIQPTDYDVKLKYGFGTRQRRISGSVRGRAARALVLALQRANRGPLRNFLLIPDDDSSDALYADLVTDGRTINQITMRLPNDDLVEIALQFDEQQKGLAL